MYSGEERKYSIAKYINAYTVLLFLLPWIDKILRKCEEKELFRLVAVCFVLFSIAGITTDSFRIDYGYGFTWLIYNVHYGWEVLSST